MRESGGHCARLKLASKEPEVQGTECAAAAVEAGLVYVTDENVGVLRSKRGTGFRYSLNGKRVSDRAELQRIKALVIPPAWTEVWICAVERGHLQATGRDAKGRKQYRYHADFRAARESSKYDRILDFAALLPAIRSKVERDLSLKGLPRDKVLATVVRLLETTLIRVGNEDYAQSNKSYGLTTLRDPHVRIEGSEMRFQFRGKSGKEWQLKVADRRIAKIVRSCQELPGQKLFQYIDEAGERQGVTSSDVNAYLRAITGADVTAKDFRTWAGTIMAALALREIAKFQSATQAKRNLTATIKSIATRLGNTPAICRRCYIHPEVSIAYLEGGLALGSATTTRRVSEAALSPEERMVVGFLRARIRG